MSGICIFGSHKILGSLRMTLKFMLDQWVISDFIQAFKDQKREGYGRQWHAKYCLRMAEICIVQGKDGTLTENWYMIKTSGKQPS